MTRPPRILALESSCDETACAVVEGSVVWASLVASQIELHRPYGGIVPELASRHHLDAVTGLLRQALAEARCSWHDLDALAVTDGPGLVGALLVGVQVARGLSLATGLPLLGIDHMEGHIFSVGLTPRASVVVSSTDVPSPREPSEAPGFSPSTGEPHLALLVSGGHTELVAVGGLGSYTILGATRDDAAGEAFDKVAKLFGLPYPGGPVIDRLAASGNPAAYPFPRAMLDHAGYDLSFSGLKTAARVLLTQRGAPDSAQALADLCASFQAAVVETLFARTRKAARDHGFRRVQVAGGVAANRGLRERFTALAEDGITVQFPAPAFCGDNAAMIAAAAAARFGAGRGRAVSLDPARSLDTP